MILKTSRTDIIVIHNKCVTNNPVAPFYYYTTISTPIPNPTPTTLILLLLLFLLLLLLLLLLLFCYYYYNSLFRTVIENYSLVTGNETKTKKKHIREKEKKERVRLNEKRLARAAREGRTRRMKGRLNV